MSSSGWLAHSQEWRNGYGRGYIVGRKGAAHASLVRFREGTPEMRCGSCAAGSGVSCYWPITTEFWNPRNMTACRACLLIRKRLQAKAAYWADPETHRTRARLYHEAQQKVILLKKRARYAEDPAKANAATAAYRIAHRDALRAYRKAYYAKNRERILLREKLRRAGVLGQAA